MDRFEKLWLIVERKVEPLTAQQVWKNDVFRESPVGSVIWGEEGNGILEYGTKNTGFSAYTVLETFAALTIYHLDFAKFKKIIPSSWGCDSDEKLGLMD